MFLRILLSVSKVWVQEILMVLGIIGEYLGKMILIMNKTPQFIVRETINVENEDTTI